MMLKKAISIETRRQTRPGKHHPGFFCQRLHLLRRNAVHPHAMSVVKETRQDCTPEQRQDIADDLCGCREYVQTLALGKCGWNVLQALLGAHGHHGARILNHARGSLVMTRVKRTLRATKKWEACFPNQNTWVSGKLRRLSRTFFHGLQAHEPGATPITHFSSQCLCVGLLCFALFCDPLLCFALLCFVFMSGQMCLIDTASHRIMVQHKSGPQTVQASALHVGEEPLTTSAIESV